MITFWSGLKPSLKWFLYNPLRINGKWTSCPVYLIFENWNIYLPFCLPMFPYFSKTSEISDGFGSLTCLFSHYLRYQSPGLDLEQRHFILPLLHLCFLFCRIHCFLLWSEEKGHIQFLKARKKLSNHLFFGSLFLLGTVVPVYWWNLKGIDLGSNIHLFPFGSKSCILWFSPPPTYSFFLWLFASGKHQ